MALISQPYTRKLVLRPGAVSGGWKPVQASPQTSVSLGRLRSHGVLRRRGFIGGNALANGLTRSSLKIV